LKTIETLFEIASARSGALDSYVPGRVAFVTNGFRNNGVVGYVTPGATDRVFQPPCIVVSAFCEATYHNREIIARGNGGSGLVVLRPLSLMTENEMLYYASQINTSLKWRYSYGRMVTKERLARELVAEPPIDLNALVPRFSTPRESPRKAPDIEVTWGLFKLSTLFDIRSGDYHNAGDLEEGNVPLISCGAESNGIVRFVSVENERIYRNVISIAYNGQPLVAYFHPYAFATKDDIGVCFPRLPFSLCSLFFIVYAINREQWRFSYGRKCFREKLGEQEIRLPVMEMGMIDEHSMTRFVTGASFWDAYSQRIADKSPIELSPFLVLGDNQ